MDFALLLKHLSRLERGYVKGIYRVPGGLLFKFRGERGDEGLLFGLRVGPVPLASEEVEVLEDSHPQAS